MGTARQTEVQADGDTRYHLMLFVAGDEPNSRAARENLASLREQELHGRAQVEVVDVLEDFETAAEHNILVTPTLLVLRPPPPVTIVGNLSDEQKLREALSLGGK